VTTSLHSDPDEHVSLRAALALLCSTSMPFSPDRRRSTTALEAIQTVAARPWVDVAPLLATPLTGANTGMCSS
jgi:hypothetical protein